MPSPGELRPKRGITRSTSPTSNGSFATQAEFAGKKARRQPKDDSRSAKAYRAGAALKAGGASYEEMRDALLAHKDPEIAEWAQTKGMADGERELRRIFDKAWKPGSIVIDRRRRKTPRDARRA